MRRRTALALPVVVTAAAGGAAVGLAARRDAVLAAPPATAPVPGRGGEGPAGRVEFEVHDADGRLLDFAAVRRVQSAGTGQDGHDDVLVDAQDLRVLVPWPLEEGPSFAVQRPAGRVALAMAWPTSAGYGQLVVDLPPPGRYGFTLVAAAQAVAELEAQLAARPGHRPSAAVTGALERARDLLARVRSATGAGQRGALGTRALDAAVGGQLRLLREHGREEALRRGAAGDVQRGVTFEDPSRHDALASVRELTGGDPRTGWVRLVFDAERGARSYAADVAAVRAAGLHVVGQFLDSSQLAGVDGPAWRARVAEYVGALPQVEEWEVGNEVNGAWTGEGSAAKALWAARHVKQNSGARTLLTLYWQMGEGEPEESVFTWAARHLPAAAVGDVDDIGLSVYPEDHPLGATLDRVLTTLHRAYPDQQLLVSELGYGAADLSGRWWFGSPDDVGAGRVAVAAFHGDAAFGYPFSRGGVFWWYYLTEAVAPSPLRAALAAPRPRAVQRRARSVRGRR
ncbi:Tat pathway signal sequence [Kineococcus indalonis]|uniref:Tat pathway signal sequence n=1 Tax=Kineococcus indalonis TaxID=2696566 RepID=UPI0014136672|nr:Tat pathway signal sequence [Kineococcus indalonis]NAZ86199.1 Tat pathway signal sequence [Kineococcus indalonis]